MDFDWDAAKAAANRRKHGVSFDEASTAILDPFAIILEDEAHSQLQERRIAIGMSIRSRTLFVVHLEQDEKTIRIISARKATANEKRDYEDNAKNHFRGF
jgi:hypothetical protein